MQHCTLATVVAKPLHLGPQHTLDIFSPPCYILVVVMDYYPSGTEKDGFAWFWAPGPTPDSFTLHKNSGASREVLTREQLRSRVEVLAASSPADPYSREAVDSGPWLRMYREGLRHLFNEITP